ncbi:Protein FAM63B, partial [Stegodyphus mimosarum]
MHDAMAVLPKLQTGLDVNVKFTGIGDFEYTPECIIFDLLRIPLYHGWLIDPQMTDVVKAVGKCSYNQLVEKIINSKSSLDADQATEALVAENFLEKTASQLTYHGLCELTSHLKEDELCVLFRNNHFSSLIKHKNCLYQLVTDQGFLNENVVWETLNNIEGDGQFVDSSFVLVPPKSSNLPLSPNVSEEQQIDQDYLVALSLQEEQQKQQNSELEWEDFKKKKLGVSNGLTDEELAKRLQEEEMREQDNQRPQQEVPQHNTRNRSRDCIIL